MNLRDKPWIMLGGRVGIDNTADGWGGKLRGGGELVAALSVTNLIAEAG